MEVYLVYSEVQYEGIDLDSMKIFADRVSAEEYKEELETSYRYSDEFSMLETRELIFA